MGGRDQYLRYDFFAVLTYKIEPVKANCFLKKTGIFDVSAWSLVCLNEAANKKITTYFNENNLL